MTLTFPLGAIARKLAALSVVVRRKGLSTTVGTPSTVLHGYATMLSKLPTVMYTCGEANESSTATMDQTDQNQHQRHAIILAQTSTTSPAYSAKGSGTYSLKNSFAEDWPYAAY